MLTLNNVGRGVQMIDHTGRVLVCNDQAAEMLGVSRDFLYRHHRRLPFSRRMGRSLLFSAQGIQKYIQRGHAPGAQRAAGTVDLGP